MDFSLEQYLKELLKEAEGTLPPEQVEAARRVLAHEKVAPKVKETVLMRSDYSRAMDKQRESQQELEKKLQEVREFYEAQVLADHNNAEAWKKMQDENARLKASGLPAGEESARPDGNAKYLTVDEVDRREKELQANALKLMSKTNFLSLKHFKEFGEVLDVDAWYKHAMDKGVPLDVAYDSYTADLRQKRVEEQHQKEIKEAEERGAMNYASKHNLPLVDTRPRGIHALSALKGQTEIPKTSSERIRAATEAYLRQER